MLLSYLQENHASNPYWLKKARNSFFFFYIIALLNAKRSVYSPGQKKCARSLRSAWLTLQLYKFSVYCRRRAQPNILRVRQTILNIEGSKILFNTKCILKWETNYHNYTNNMGEEGGTPGFKFPNLSSYKTPSSIIIQQPLATALLYTRAYEEFSSLKGEDKR